MKNVVKSLIESHYTQHQKRKTSCVNESKIKEFIDKSVEEKSTKLNVPLCSPDVIQSIKK